MENTDFKFIKFFTIDLLEVEIYKNSDGQYKTVCTLIDCDDIGRIQYYADFKELYYLFSDYLDNVELNFEPCVIMLNHQSGRS